MFFVNKIYLLLILSLMMSGMVSVLNNSTVVGTTDCLGYKVTKIWYEKELQLRGRLELIGEPCNMYSEDEPVLLFKVDYYQSRLRLQITNWPINNDTYHTQYVDSRNKGKKGKKKKGDKNKRKHDRWAVPKNLLFPDLKNPPKTPNSQSQLVFKYTQNPFTFQIIRRSNHNVLFDTTNNPLIVQDTFMQVRSSLPNNANIYGIGEFVGNFKRNVDDTVQAMWARDVADPSYENLYGTHPFYLELRHGLSHGVHMLNSYGMDVILKDQTITYNMLGGVIDLSFFSGPTAYDVMDQYTSTFGRPMMIPYWALGFHQCKYGYKSIEEVEEVVHQYKVNRLPLETMWTDIEYMDTYKDFTLDPINYPLEKVQKFIKKLHKHHQHYVLIIDPAISRNESYSTYTEGKRLKVFIKNPDGSDYIGQVWPGFTAFPDWFAPNTQAWWTSHIHQFLDKIPVDGLWIDMNEPASFCTGSCGSNLTGIPPYPWEDPNYRPDLPQHFLEPNYSIHNHYGNLSVKTVRTDAMHYGGLTEFQVHNLFGHMEGIATRRALAKHSPKKRPFVLSRSTFTGSGAVMGHWTGDNLSSWEHLKLSISGVLSFQLFGIPYVGADICGFNGDTTEELCLRWMQLGSLYPFARNHNAIHQIPQEPYRWASVADASRKALKVRYEMLPYLYSLSQLAHQHGQPIWTPLSFEFPKSNHLFSVDEQFLLGKSLLVSPALYQGQTTVQAIIPEGHWYSYYHPYEHLVGPNTVSLSSGLDENMNLHVRAGHIIPIFSHPKLTTHHTRSTSPYRLVVAYDLETNEAHGELYLDDGISTDIKHKYSSIKFNLVDNLLFSEGVFNYHPTNLASDYDHMMVEDENDTITIESILILGLPKFHPIVNSLISRKITSKNRGDIGHPTSIRVEGLDPLHEFIRMNCRVTNFNLSSSSNFKHTHDGSSLIGVNLNRLSLPLSTPFKIRF